jgi:hypothetical protein
MASDASEAQGVGRRHASGTEHLVVAVATGLVVVASLGG